MSERALVDRRRFVDRSRIYQPQRVGQFADDVKTTGLGVERQLIDDGRIQSKVTEF